MTSKTIVAIFGIPATVCRARADSRLPVPERRIGGDRRRRGGRRADARHADDPAPAGCASRKAARPARAAGSGRRPDRGCVPQLAAREHRRDAAARARVCGRPHRGRQVHGRDRPVLPRDRALLGRLPLDAQTSLEFAKTLGRNTIIQGRADNFLHPSVLPGPERPGLSRVRADREQRLARAGIAAPGRGAPGVGRGRCTCGGARRIPAMSRRRSRSGSPSSTRTISRPRSRTSGR